VVGSPWLEGESHRRVLRGGTWDWMANMVRAGYRENAIVDGGRPQFSRGADAERAGVRPAARGFLISGDHRLMAAS
jgi:hypothetical protein